MTTIVMSAVKYKGYDIQYEEGEGFHWRYGGYCDSIAEIKKEIDDYNQEKWENDPSYPRQDSPSLGNPWWEYR